MPACITSKTPSTGARGAVYAGLPPGVVALEPYYTKDNRAFADGSVIVYGQWFASMAEAMAAHFPKGSCLT